MAKNGDKAFIFYKTKGVVTIEEGGEGEGRGEGREREKESPAINI
jgi:hypothetical protein